MSPLIRSSKVTSLKEQNMQFTMEKWKKKRCLEIKWCQTRTRPHKCGSQAQLNISTICPFNYPSLYIICIRLMRVTNDTVNPHTWGGGVEGVVCTSLIAKLCSLQFLSAYTTHTHTHTKECNYMQRVRVFVAQVLSEWGLPLTETGHHDACNSWALMWSLRDRGEMSN